MSRLSSSLGALLMIGLFACSSGDNEPGTRTPGQPLQTGTTKNSGKNNDAGSSSKGVDAGKTVTPLDSGGASSTTESCDGVDNDGNGQVDEGCACAPGKTQVCYAGTPATRHKGTCKDGEQKCEKGGEFGKWGACTGSVLPGTENCSNKIDDDCDGLIDCQDSDCPPCSEDCKDGKDNDGDGQIDCKDPDCPSCDEWNCSDGIDDDQDGKTDCNDNDCPCFEDCADDQDNNNNGKTDCDDPACANAPQCNCGPNGECCDGKDNNGNGVIDEGNVCRLVGEPCPPGAIQACDCYCGVHRKCEADGTWGPCLVDGNYTCMPAIATQSACGILGMYCDFGLCAGSMDLGNECVHHTDCPMPLICDLGFCVPDNYKPCL